MSKKVYLVGAGPGDEELITLKAINVLKSCDVIIYDNLISDQILNYAPLEAERIYVGKRKGRHSLSQEQINDLIVEKANEEKIVVRLKGGDPFVFGRGGEEALRLYNEKVPFEVVPGITSAIAVPAYVGIPVTHRGLSTTFTVITGHEDPEKDEQSVDYKVLAQMNGTLVFLMGFTNLSKIADNLLENGKSPDTPVAVISSGCTADQKVVKATLGDIYEKSKNLNTPAIIVIGDVVNLRDTIKWIENRPLFGRKILVTRARHQASILSEKIITLGGSVIEYPTIEIQEIHNNPKLQTMYDTLPSYDWIIFTSVNGVEVFFKHLVLSGKDIRQIGGAKICAIGEATKSELVKRYLKVDFTPEEYVAEALIEGLKQKINAGDKVLIPRADVAREILPEELGKTGAIVDVIPLYQTIVPENKMGDLVLALKEVDTVTFTSSSTVTNFVQILGEYNLNKLKSVKIACIGPVTAETAKNSKIKVDVVAEKYTIDGLVDALVNMNQLFDHSSEVNKC